jgi:nucleoside-diphosphate-sugar epimerase
MITDPPPRFKHAFVTGSTGLVGVPLCNRLAEMGVEVTAFSRNASSVNFADGVNRVSGDMLDANSVLEAAKNADVIYHVAAAVHGSESSYEGFRRMNVDGTANVVNAAKSLGVRMVHVSTVNVDGFNRGVLVDPYAQTKAEAEALVLGAVNDGLDAVMVRPATVFGSVAGRAGLIVDRILAGSLKVMPAPSRKISPVWTEDLSTALIRAAQVGATGHVYTVAGPTISSGDFAKSVSASAGVGSYKVSIPAWVIALPLQLAWLLKGITRVTPPVTVEAVRSGSVHDGSDAAAELGFEYTPISEIFRRL